MLALNEDYNMVSDYKELIAEAADYYAGHEQPNVIGELSLLKKGCVGFSAWSNKNPDDVESYYCPISTYAYGVGGSGHIQDRLAMFAFFDANPDALVYEDPIMQQANYYSPSKNGIPQCVDYRLLASSVSCAALNSFLIKENVYAFYNKFFVDMFTALGKKDAPNLIGTLVTTPTPFTTDLIAGFDEIMELHRVCDRIDLISKLDGVSHKTVVMNATVKDAPWERVMIIPEERAYLHIYQEPGMATPSAAALSKYRTVQVDYVIDREIFSNLKS